MAKPATDKTNSRNRENRRRNKPSNKQRGDQRSPKPIPDGIGNKDQRRAEEIVDTAEKTIMSKGNPWTWYTAFERFSQAVSQLAFGIPVGQPFEVGSGDFTANAGVMTLEFIPTPGNSVDLTSPINRQTFKFYSYLRSMLRSANAYDAADVMMYFMAIDALYMFWAMMRRAYRTAQLFSPLNIYYPRRLLQAQGIDPSIASNLADFRDYINYFAINISRFTMPKTFDINERHMWMCEGVYLDSDTTRAQAYMFVPTGFYQFDNTVTTGSELKLQWWIDPTQTQPAFHTFEQIVEFGNSLLNAVTNDQDTMNISGDLYRAFGKGNIRVLEELTANEILAPSYDEDVLSQIENSVAVGTPILQTIPSGGATLAQPTISQNPSVNNGAIVFDGYYAAGAVNVGGANVYNYPLMHKGATLNSHVDQPQGKHVLEMTRLIPVTEQEVPVAVGRIAIGLESHGADLIIQYRICVTNPDNPAAVRFITARTNTIYVSNSGVLQDTSQLEWVALSQQFDWAPMIYIVQYTPVAGGVPGLDLKWIAADVDNMTRATSQQMKNIHEAAMLSLFEIPEPFQPVS